YAGSIHRADAAPLGDDACSPRPSRPGAPAAHRRRAAARLTAGPRPRSSRLGRVLRAAVTDLVPARNVARRGSRLELGDELYPEGFRMPLHARDRQVATIPRSTCSGHVRTW